MFFRTKPAGSYRYLQIVHSVREGKKVRQQVIATLGRLDLLEASGQLERLMRSGLRHCQSFAVIDAHAAGEIQPVAIRRIGPDLVFGRLWKESGIPEVLRSVLKARQYEFDVERAIYLTVLHRLFASGSDRAAERWREDYLIPGTEGLELHHLYRAMAFLGDAIEQLEKPTGAVRCNKDLIEEALFERRRDLFTEVELVFFDTTSLYFEGRGGESIGQRGHTKDHRPDLKQMIVGMALDVEGRPICCEMWPGNTADVTTLLPVVKRMRKRFRIREITVVADRGMVSQETLEAFVAQLKEQLRKGDKSLVGNKGYRRYLKVEGSGHFVIDEKQVKAEERYDGIWVLRTNTVYNAETIAHVYKALWTVEDMIRTAKSILETRPIYHKCNETIRGHVFCSFLALLLKTELERRMKFADLQCEWAQVVRGLEALQQVEATFQNKRFLLRSQLAAEASAALRATGVAAPPTLRELP